MVRSRSGYHCIIRFEIKLIVRTDSHSRCPNFNHLHSLRLHSRMHCLPTLYERVHATYPCLTNSLADKPRMKHARSVDRDDEDYKKYFYRSPRQPFPAYFAILSCACLVIFNGWETFYNISQHTISPSDAAVNLISAYLGPILFLGYYLIYKFAKGTHMTSYANMGNSYTPMEAGLDGEPSESKNVVIRFLSWLS